MGFMTTYVVLNDGASGLKEDPNVGKTMLDLLLRMQGKRMHEQVDGRLGHHGNAITAVAQHHADDVSVILVGGNMATVVGQVHNGGHVHDREDIIGVLEAVAAGLGFRLTPITAVEKLGDIARPKRPEGVRIASINERLKE